MLTGEISAWTLALAGMGTVFCCLAVLYAFFAATGRISVWYRDRRASGKPAAETRPQEAAEIPGELVAAIALALAQARPATRAIATAGGLAEVRVSPAGLTWREQGRLLQHQRSRDWERK